MALIGRLFGIFFGFLFACLAAGMIVVGAVLYPEFTDLGTGPIDQSAINVVLGFGFIFLSGFALLPALIVVLITEAFYIRGALTYAVGGAIVGAACYLGLIPFNPWPGTTYECSDWDQIEKFSEYIFDAGYSSPVRTPRGRDILAACGQLKSETEKLSARERQALRAMAMTD